MDGYILQGTDEEYLLVIRSHDIKLILDVIDRIAASRKSGLKELAWELEKSLHDDGSRRNSGKAGFKNKTKSSNATSPSVSRTSDGSKPPPMIDRAFSTLRINVAEFLSR